MNVFVETNFVVEVALEQQEASFCETFMQLADEGSIRLLLPAYSFIEPHEMLTRRHLDRAGLRARVSSELAQLARSTPLAERVAASQEMLKLLIDSAEYEAKRIEQVKERLWATGEVLPLDVTVLQRAAECRSKFALSPQDAVVYASIRSRLEIDHTGASCFVSRNPGDFDDPDLRNDLAAMNCKYFSSFSTALQYVKHALGLSPDA